MAAGTFLGARALDEAAAGAFLKVGAPDDAAAGAFFRDLSKVGGAGAGAAGGFIEVGFTDDGTSGDAPEENCKALPCLGTAADACKGDVADCTTSPDEVFDGRRRLPQERALITLEVGISRDVADAGPDKLAASIGANDVTSALVSEVLGRRFHESALLIIVLKSAAVRTTSAAHLSFSTRTPLHPRGRVGCTFCR